MDLFNSWNVLIYSVIYYMREREGDRKRERELSVWSLFVALLKIEQDNLNGAWTKKRLEWINSNSQNLRIIPSLLTYTYFNKTNIIWINSTGITEIW